MSARDRPMDIDYTIRLIAEYCLTVILAVLLLGMVKVTVVEIIKWLRKKITRINKWSEW